MDQLHIDTWIDKESTYSSIRNKVEAMREYSALKQLDEKSG
jgi:hypothetical protein